MCHRPPCPRARLARYVAIYHAAAGAVGPLLAAAFVYPAVLVLGLTIVNLFVAGPPLKTVVLDSAGASYGASLPFMKLRVQDSMAKFNLWPEDEMTHFFVITCSAPPAATTKLHLQAQVCVRAQTKPVQTKPSRQGQFRRALCR